MTEQNRKLMHGGTVSGLTESDIERQISLKVALRLYLEELNDEVRMENWKVASCVHRGMGHILRQLELLEIQQEQEQQTTSP